MKKKQATTRREFIKNTSVAAIGSALFLGETGETQAKTKKLTKVVLVRDKAVFDEKGQPRKEILLNMLDSAMTGLTGEKNAQAAWKSIIKPSDIVGIKSNVWQYIPTTSQVEQAIKQRVQDTGVKDANIGIDDRQVLSNPVFKKATALINARPMRTHHWSGVGSLLKNYIMFVPDPYNYHADSCADLATIWNKSIVKSKTRLNVLVMLTPQFHSKGPHNFNPKYVRKYYGLIVGFDPVAVDSVGLRIMQAIRKDHFGEFRPINPPAKHILLADTRHHLGTADPNKIDLIKIGYADGILI